MILSKKGAAFIRGHEGFRSKAYRDPIGVLTLGIGFTWRSAAFRSWWNLWKPHMRFDERATMTPEEADDALQFIVQKEYGKAVDAFLGDQQVPQHVYDAMVSAVFNLGPGALRWSWAKAIKEGDYATAAKRLMATGTTAKGKTLPGLVRRRKEEAMLLQHGVYTGVYVVPKKQQFTVSIDNLLPPKPKPSKWWQRLFGLTKGA